MDGKVSIAKFGIFTKGERKAREARNPRTGEMVNVPARGNIKFQPAKTVKELMK
jgi:nucleoid DNA-binding protein